MKNILITGGTGLIGKHLSERLIQNGYRVSVLSRKRNNNSKIPVYAWDVEKKTIDNEALENVDYIVHLAGANIGERRWTAERKQLILDSRVKSSNLIFEELKRKDIKLKAFISASAVGYYGAVTSNKIFNETDFAPNDFLGETCRLWEQTTDQFENAGIRTVIIRTGIVLAKEDGALSKMMGPVKMGIGSAIGDGKQYIPWIHIDDICNIFIKAIEDDAMHGAYNAVSPDPKTNKEFTKIVAKVLNAPFWFPAIPAFALKLMFGKMSEIFLKGSRVSSDKISATGFQFRFPELEKALKNILDK
jgi:uncharacterized protein (TIGR01777 family)